VLRPEAGRNAEDKALIELVGELSTRSELFRQRGASQDVRFHRTGRKRLRHPVVGQLDLDLEGMELPSEPGLQLNIYTAAAGTPTADALKLLASWLPPRTTCPPRLLRPARPDEDSGPPQGGVTAVDGHWRYPAFATRVACPMTSAAFHEARAAGGTPPAPRGGTPLARQHGGKRDNGPGHRREQYGWRGFGRAKTAGRQINRPNVNARGLPHVA
jgi:hypothetical protein